MKLMCRAVSASLLAAALAADSAAARPATLCTGNVEAAYRSYDEGMKLLDKGSVAKGKKLLLQALEHLPCHPEAHRELGNLAMKEERFQEALTLYESSLADYEQAGLMLRERAMKHWTDSRDDIARLRQEQSRIRTGTSEINQDQIVRAADIEVRINDLEAMPMPSDEPIQPPGDIYFYIGNALMRLKRGDEALARFEICREKAPKFGPVYNNLAILYWRRGRLAEAWGAVLKAEELKVEVNPVFKNELRADMKKNGVNFQ